MVKFNLPSAPYDYWLMFIFVVGCLGLIPAIKIHRMVRSKGALLVGISFFLAGFIRLLVSFTNIEPVASTQFIDYFICVPLIIAVIGKWMLWSNISEYVHWSEPKAPTSMKKIVDTQEAIKSSQLSEDKTQSEIAKVQMRIEAREKLLVKMLRKLIGK